MNKKGNNNPYNCKCGGRKQMEGDYRVCPKCGHSERWKYNSRTSNDCYYFGEY